MKQSIDKMTMNNEQVWSRVLKYLQSYKGKIFKTLKGIHKRTLTDNEVLSEVTMVLYKLIKDDYPHRFLFGRKFRNLVMISINKTADVVYLPHYKHIKDKKQGTISNFTTCNEYDLEILRDEKADMDEILLSNQLHRLFKMYRGKKIPYFDDEHLDVCLKYLDGRSKRSIMNEYNYTQRHINTLLKEGLRPLWRRYKKLAGVT